MTASRLAAYDASSPHDGIVRLHDVTWADYERLLQIRGECAVPRLTHLRGELELMSPSKTHELVKSMIGPLVEVWCLDKGIEFTTVGSWTLEDEALERGIVCARAISASS